MSPVANYGYIITQKKSQYKLRAGAAGNIQLSELLRSVRSVHAPHRPQESIVSVAIRNKNLYRLQEKGL